MEKSKSVGWWEVLGSVLVLLGWFAPLSSARDLTDVFSQGSTFAVPGAVNPLSTAQAVNQIVPSFSDAVSQAVTQEFPLAAVAPAFTYRYNPAIKLYEP